MEVLFLLAILVAVGFIFSFSSSFDKGAAGEHQIYRRLAYFENEGRGKLLSNIYLPKATGGTTEIDLLLIHPKGLFVFESKNYSGWIFGSEDHQNWTQTLPKGRYGDVHKERFYNPILQNASHIRHLMPHIGKIVPVWSIIVFSDRCELKDIMVRSRNVFVVQCHHVSSVVEQICSESQTDCLSETEVVDLYNKLFVLTNVSEEEKEDHAQKVFEVKQRLQ